MKIYQMNDCEWWMAESEEDAIRDIALHYGSGYGTDKVELVRDGYLNEDCPRELTNEEMDRLRFVDEMGNPESPKRSFREELRCRIEAGVTKPEMFASTEF